MPRQSFLLWLGLTGIFLFLAGIFLNRWRGHEEKINLKQGTAEQIIRNPLRTSKDSSSSSTDFFSLRLDSMRVMPMTTSYELQVRKSISNFEPQFHQSVLRPSMLDKAYPLQPMKIQQVGDTPYRFRLKEFYPDFTFQYSYPANQDTIAPIDPGITLNLKTPHGEEVVTLRAYKPKMNRLDDVVQLGYAIEFYWESPLDTFTKLDDSSNVENVISFEGKDKRIIFQHKGSVTSFPLELNSFVPIPGNDSIGFTVLQCFPDYAHLKAVPATKSEKLNNPVAAVEIWKLKGLSQEIFLYPTTPAKPAGQWSVPETNFLLTLGSSHEEILKKCQCSISLIDSTKNVRKMLEFTGGQTFTFEGNRISPVECDPNGYWATLVIRRNPGGFMKTGGIIIVIASLFFFITRKKLKEMTNKQLVMDDNDQLLK